ncbi:hypothetical protein NS365_05540 [Aureimonas ureilytica]|uniref:Uncharacterized protein n=1 Tax=Aureimonas ureilytica TaxID=401562 RepID=A0A175RUA3_9HYPH|nr:hypothetical protein [Aureimonas ureilytica]KTR06898.1 hypothetical protein NS365_05540 [Aureimonas ureilytica]
MTINGAGMPGYSEKAQPYLDAIGAAVLSSAEVRDWILTGIPGAIPYLGSTPVADEQRAKRGATKQPFWANYWCGRDSRCTCRIEGSKALESDAIFFLRNTEGRTLGLHVEFKHPRETFGYGQPEGYPLRAACFAKTWAGRKTMLPHEDWATVIFCGAEAVSDPRIGSFQRIITHAEARQRIRDYPVV